MFRKLALPIALSLLSMTLLFGALQASSQISAAAPADPTAVQEPALPPFTHTYRLGIVDDITTLNVWAMHDTEQSAVNDFVLGELYPSLYRFSSQQAWVPYIASDFPTPVQAEASYFVSRVPIRSGLRWSDGSALTAVDVAFTINTAISMSLSGDWQAYNNTYLHHAEATTPLTLTLFYDTLPTIEQHQFGTLMGPIASANYWDFFVSVALNQPDPIAFLYNFVPANEPTAGPYTLVGRVPTVVISLAANPFYALRGAVIRHYANGAYRQIGPDGYSFTAYGTATGDIALSYGYGPHFDEASYHIYASQNAAAAALTAGEIDVILSENSLGAGLFKNLSSQQWIAGVENDRNQLFYLGFNHARNPLNRVAFRRALSVWLNREAIAQSANTNLRPTAALLPESQSFWFNDVAQFGDNPSIRLRVVEAVDILAEAGFTWAITPTWTTNGLGVIAGEGLRLPSGNPVPPLEILVSVDTTALTAVATPLAQALDDLGLATTVVVTDTAVYNDLIAAQGEFDLFLGKWTVAPYPSHLCDAFAASSPNNVSGYDNQQVNNACANYLDAPNMTSARTAIQQVQNVIASSVPYAALFTAPMREAYRLDRVHYPYSDAFGGFAGENGLTAVATAVISDIVQPGTRTTLRYAEADGGYIEVDIGPGSVAWPVPILLTTQTAPGYPLPSGQKFTNFAFDLEVPYDYPRLYIPYMALETTPSNNVRQPQSPQATNASTFFFFKPITVTVHYLDNDVSNVDESTLQLLYWNQQAWQDAATTCGDSGPGYSNNTQANLLRVGICHFTRFATSGN